MKGANWLPLSMCRRLTHAYLKSFRKQFRHNSKNRIFPPLNNIRKFHAAYTQKVYINNKISNNNKNNQKKYISNQKIQIIRKHPKLPIFTLPHKSCIVISAKIFKIITISNAVKAVQ